MFLVRCDVCGKTVEARMSPSRAVPPDGWSSQDLIKAGARRQYHMCSDECRSQVVFHRAEDQKSEGPNLPML